jgi:hypothetical protein
MRRMSRYDLTDSEWRVIEPLLPNKPRGVPHKIVAGEFCKFRFDIELPPSNSAASSGCPPLLSEPSAPPATPPSRKPLGTARTPPSSCSLIRRSSFAIGRRGSFVPGGVRFAGRFQGNAEPLRRKNSKMRLGASVGRIGKSPERRPQRSAIREICP